jgi:hypothetical protein
MKDHAMFSIADFYGKNTFINSYIIFLYKSPINNTVR